MRHVHPGDRRGMRNGRDVLTLRAVPRLADLVRVPARLDHRSAHVTGQPCSLVYPHPLARVEPEVGAPSSAVAVEADELSRVLHDLAKRRVVEFAYLGPRPDPG